MQEIHIDIAPDGGLQIDAVGFSGTDCEQATRFLETALGQIARKQKKPEYYQQRSGRTSQKLHTGRRSP